ncbi:MAG: methyltransferase [Planctomycetota bacterium]
MDSPQPENNLAASSLHCTFGKLELDLDVPEGVWNPTPNGILLGETLEAMDFTGESILELGTGCGVHAVVLGLRGAREMLLTEIDDGILSHAKKNLDKYGIETKTRFIVADWIQIDVSGYDTLIANPPYCVSGKNYRRYFIDTLILEAHKLIRPGGRIIFIHSTMADSPRTIRLMEESGMKVKILAEKDYPFRDYYFEDPLFMLEMAKVPGSYTVRDGVHHERLMVFEGTLPEN